MHYIVSEGIGESQVDDHVPLSPPFPFLMYNIHHSVMVIHLDDWMSAMKTCTTLGISRPSDHIPQIASIGTSLLWRPPHLALGRTHLGSIKSFVHDSTEFSLATALRAADKTRANAALAYWV